MLAPVEFLKKSSFQNLQMSNDKNNSSVSKDESSELKELLVEIDLKKELISNQEKDIQSEESLQFESAQTDESSNNQLESQCPLFDKIWSAKKFRRPQIDIPPDSDYEPSFPSNGSHTVKNSSRASHNKIVFPQQPVYQPNSTKINIPSAILFNSLNYQIPVYPNNFNSGFGLPCPHFPSQTSTTPNINFKRSNNTNYNNFFSNGSSPNNIVNMGIFQENINCIGNMTVNNCNNNNGGLVTETVIENIITNKEKRTSLMISHIPIKYNAQSILFEIDSTLKIDSPDKRFYDIFYLPLSRNDKSSGMAEIKKEKNLGYAFINLIHPLYVIDFYYKFKNFKWNKYHSNKEFCVKFANVQGKKNLMEIYRQSYGEEKKPNIFETNEELLNFEENKDIKILVDSKFTKQIQEHLSSITHIFNIIDEQQNYD